MFTSCDIKGEVRTLIGVGSSTTNNPPDVRD